METSKIQERSARHSLRVLRPLLWWFIFVLVLYGIRKHQRLMDQTRLNYSLSFQGKPAYAKGMWDNDPLNFMLHRGNIDPSVTLDGQPAFSGQHIPLGSHTFNISHPKAESFSTNLFVWYGGHDFGTIDLKRARGILSVTAEPRASVLTIQGPEFTLTLTDSAGVTQSVPTDAYSIEAQWVNYRQTEPVVVGGELPASVRLAPQLGTVMLQSDPTGATVFDSDGRKLGTTPLTLLEIQRGSWKFNLERDGYETAVTTVTVTASQTNHFEVNLVDRYYAEAMRAARNQFETGRYDAAVESAEEALKHKADDPAAMSLRREVTGLSHVARARTLAERNDFQGAIGELNTALQFIPENAAAKESIADYTKRATELVEQERARREAELAERKAGEKIKELHDSFNVLLRAFENSAQFEEHELVTSNAVGGVSANVKQELSGGEPTFKIVRFEQTRPDMFALQARQTMIIGYRDCFVVGEQVREGETRILFKVLEYDHSPTLNILGILTAVVRQEHDAAQQARFRQQIREGAPMVEQRIRRALQ